MDERILVVNDEKPICDMLNLALTRAGYSVVVAESAEAAVTAMETEKCPVTFIDFRHQDPLSRSEGAGCTLLGWNL
jgi:DNA-binding NtrC family response regulator